ncbi:hypothetical protein [Phenylobacterium sp.]|uniref:terminase small subunit-like protein n=1 Tax=Phenylobacterium sp. TaxID=1871053 RepID=UPI002ED8C0A9
MAGPERWDPRRPGAAALGESVWCEDVAAEIVAGVAAGRSVRAICAEPGRPHRTTVRRWAVAHPDFGAALFEARRQVMAAQRRKDRMDEAERRAEVAARQRARVAAGDGRGGKASEYTPELGERICARLEAGESLIAICEDEGMPVYGTVLKWVKRFPEFQEMYVAARTVQGDYLFDEAREVAKGAKRARGDGGVAAARLQFDVIRWQTARLAPRKYLERLVAAEAKAADGADGDEDGIGGDGGPLEIVFSVTRFENVGGRVLAAPPRNAREAEAWVEATGRPYEAGVGPNGEIRPPMGTPEAWARAEAFRARLERERAGRRR